MTLHEIGTGLAVLNLLAWLAVYRSSKRMTRMKPYALAGYLLEHNPAYAYTLDISAATGIRSGDIYLMLEDLEDTGIVEATWLDQPDGKPQRRAYRLSAREDR